MSLDGCSKGISREAISSLISMYSPQFRNRKQRNENYVKEENQIIDSSESHYFHRICFRADFLICLDSGPLQLLSYKQQSLAYS